MGENSGEWNKTHSLEPPKPQKLEYLSVNDCVQSSSVGLQQPKGNLMLDQKLLFARLIHTQKQRAHTTVWVEDSHRSLHLQIYYTISNMKSIDLNSLSSPDC